MASRGGQSHFFDPLLVHVEVGGTVQWVVETGMHNSVAYHPDNDDRLESAAPLRMPEEAEPWASPLMDRREGETTGESPAGLPLTYERTFETEGVYNYACTPHESYGMVGSVLVGWPDPNGQPALEASGDSLTAAARQTLELVNQQAQGVLEEGPGGGGGGNGGNSSGDGNGGGGGNDGDGGNSSGGNGDGG